MSDWSDRDLGMQRDITRPDFVNGIGVAVGEQLVERSRASRRDSVAIDNPTAYYPLSDIRQRKRSLGCN